MRNLISLLFFTLFVFAANAQKAKAGLLFTADSIYHKTEEAILPFVKGCAPEKVDLSYKLPPVGNQLPQNSCVAWALGYSCRSYYNTDKPSVPTKGVDYRMVVSPAFIYNLLNGGKNNGINIQNAFRLLTDTGSCSYKSMPYSKYNWTKQPAAKQVQEAYDYRIETFRKLDLKYALLTIKGELIAGNPILAASYFDIKYYNYGYNTKAKFYVWDTISTLDKRMGHAITIIGYDDSLMAFKFMNSFGTDWGNKGYGWISYNNIGRALREAYIIKPARVELPQQMPTPNQTQPKDEPHGPGGVKDGGAVFSANEVALERSHGTGYTNEGDTLITTTVRFLLPSLPAKSIEIVLQYFKVENGEKGSAIFSRNDDYQLANGQAAASSGTIYLNPGSLPPRQFSISIPRSALDLPFKPDQSVAFEVQVEPVLFTDGFPMRKGVPSRFVIR